MTRPWIWRWRKARLARQLPPQALDGACGDLLEEFGVRCARDGRWRSELWLASEMSALGRAYRIEREGTAPGGRGSWLPKPGGLAYALRGLARAPWYSAASIGVLAISVSLATAVFAIVDGTLFKALPYPDADRLFAVDLAYSKLAEPFVTLPFVSEADFEEWRRAMPDVTMTAYELIGDQMVGVHQSVKGAVVDERFFDVFGQRPMIGGFAPEDFQTHQPIGRALVTYSFWQERLGGAREAIGRALVDENGNGIVVAGVLPPDFLFPYPTGVGGRPDVLRPRVSSRVPSRGSSFNVAIRTPSSAAGAAIEQRLQAELARQVNARAPVTLPPTTTARRRVTAGGFDRLRLDPLRDALTSLVHDGALATFAATAALVLLACLNLAGLMTARQTDRRRELVMRRALGARTIDLVGLLAVESACLVAAGTAIGVWGAKVVLGWVAPFLMSFVRVLKPPAIDWRVAVFATVTAALCAAIVTLLSARAVSRSGLRDALSEGGATTDRVTRRWSIVSVEIALGVVLLVDSALVTGSLLRAWSQDPGFDARRTALVSVLTPMNASAGDVEGFITGISRVPGVTAAGGAAHPLLDAAFNGSEFDRPAGISLSTDPFPIESVPVTHGFLQAAGLGLVDGRLPSDEEFESNAAVIVVSQTTAREFWPGQRAVGQPLVRHGRAFTVVGVVRDARLMRLDEDAQGAIYWPVAASDRHFVARVLVRFASDDPAPLGAVTSHILRTCPGCWLEGAEMLRDAMSTSIRGREFTGVLFGSFGLAALAIVGAGVLGIVAMTTSRRTREIGIRMALGATRASVMTQIVREQLAAVAIGLLAGGLVAAWVTRFVTSQLYKTPTYDPASWLVALAAIVTIAGVAALIPSRKASRVDPVQALRVD